MKVKKGEQFPIFVVVVGDSEVYKVFLELPHAETCRRAYNTINSDMEERAEIVVGKAAF